MPIKQAMIYGAIAGAIGVVFQLLMYLTDSLGSTLLAGVSFAVSIAFYVYMVKYHRDTVNNGFLSFKDIVLLVILVVTFSTLISSLVNMTHLKLDDNYRQLTIDMAVRSVEEMGATMNMSQSDIDELVETTAVESVNAGIGTILFSSLMVGGIGGGLLGLILGGIFKREPETFEEEEIIE